MLAYTEKAREQHDADMMFFMLTNILTESTDLICVGQGAEQLVSTAFHMADEDGSGDEEMEEMDGIVSLPGVVSRKKTAGAPDHDGAAAVSGGSWRKLMGKNRFKPGNMLYPVPAVMVSVADKRETPNIH